MATGSKRVSKREEGKVKAKAKETNGKRFSLLECTASTAIQVVSTADKLLKRGTEAGIWQVYDLLGQY